MENQTLSESPDISCTSACTSEGEKRQDEGRADGPGDAADADLADASAHVGQLAGAELARAMALIGELPLSAAEKAEAVRRLLGRQV